MQIMIFISLTFVIILVSPILLKLAYTLLICSICILILFSCITLLFCLWISILCRNLSILVLVLSLLVTLFLLLRVIGHFYLLGQCSYLYRCLFSLSIATFLHHPTLCFSYPLKSNDCLFLQIQFYNRFTLVEKQFFLYSEALAFDTLWTLQTLLILRLQQYQLLSDYVVHLEAQGKQLNLFFVLNHILVILLFLLCKSQFCKK